MGSGLERYQQCKCKGLRECTPELHENKTEFKISLFGPCKVGKTALTNRIVNDRFDEEYTKTLICEQPEITRIVSEEEIKVKLVNPLGDEKCIIINNYIYYKNTDALLLIFAFDDKKSFEELKQRYNNEKDNFSSKVYVIGNKIDKYLDYEVSEEEAKEFANKINLHPGIIVGRLQKEHLLSYDNKLNELK